MRILPLNITFKETLSCYDEMIMESFAEQVAEYNGTLIEIRLYEPSITTDFLDCFCKLEGFLKRQLKNGIKVKYEICTDGTGLTMKQAVFFREKSITVCLLMDGPKSIHEHNNILLNRIGSHEQAVRAARLLAVYNVNFYIGITVTSVVAKNIQRIFSFFIENGWNSHAYWPVMCVTSQKMSMELLSVEDYQYFLEQLFLLWKDSRMNRHPVYVREFENLAGVIKGYVPLVSSLSGRCPFQNVFFSNGHIYSRGCREGQEEYLCKQLEEQDLALMKSVDVKTECKMCRWVSLCQSDRTCCMNSSVFCKIYKDFYLSALPEMFELLRNLGK